MLIERVRRALAPDYEIQEEVAAGGMGVVFAARQVRLDRKVAVKILRPEHATAVAVERFLAESRVLARLTHPTVVPVYDAGEADGLLYYVMEYIAGETLAARLRRGPLPGAEVLRLAEGLLDALAAAHRLGIVHRDVKPGNIFLREGRVLLGDFGLARLTEPDGSGRTRSGELIGTPGYMAPEQREGLPATPSSDVYSAGLVLYQASSGRQWRLYQDPDKGDLTGVPAGLVAPLRRALKLAPADRWPNAEEFRNGLRQAHRGRRRRGWMAGLGAAALVVIGLAYGAWPRARESGTPPPQPASLIFVVPRFEAGSRALGDSVAAALRGALQTYPEFEVLARPPRGVSRERPYLRVNGSVIMAGDRVRLRIAGEGSSRIEPVSTADVPLAAWRTQLDTLEFLLVHSLALKDPVATDSVLPRTARGFAAWLKAEQHYARAEWEAAGDLYELAERRDPACLLCSFRLLDVERFLTQSHDPERFGRVRAGIARFPVQYRPLIRALETDLPDRLEVLKQAADAEESFFLTYLLLGEERLFRAPLHGRRRAEAIDPLHFVTRLNPGFARAWEDLAWVQISEGDSAAAREALDSLQSKSGAGRFSSAIAGLLRLGYHWRFLPADSAQRFSRTMLDDPRMRQLREATAAARGLMSMYEARGAVEVGGLLAQWANAPDAARAGLLGQLYGYAALGRLDSLSVVRDRLERRTRDPSLPMLALELETLIRAFDPDSAVRSAPGLRDSLARTIQSTSIELRPRAAFALALLALRTGDRARFRQAAGSIGEGQGALEEVLGAAAEADAGNFTVALRNLPRPSIQAAQASYGSLIEDAARHLLRAEWLDRIGESSSANEVLRWHEHMEVPGHLLGDPAAGEVAWAVGTLARWERRRLLAKLGRKDEEWCSVNRGITHAWIGAPAPFGERAAAAQQALATCLSSR